MTRNAREFQMRVDRHIFGSYKGYSTLAQSSGITSQHRHILEGFTFGQTNDRVYLESLQRQPAYISRPLGTDKRAITRVLPGPKDDQGRTTLLFATCVIDNVDSLALQAYLHALLREKSLRQWDGKQDIESVQLDAAPSGLPSLRPDEAETALRVLSEVERAYARGQTVIAEEVAIPAKIVRSVEMLAPDAVKTALSFAVRTLSAKVNVSLNCVSTAGSVHNLGPHCRLYPPGQKPELTEYAAALAATGFCTGRDPRPVIKRPTGFALPAPALASPVQPSAAADASKPQPSSDSSRRSRRVLQTGLTGACVLIVAGVGLLIGTRIGTKPPADEGDTGLTATTNPGPTTGKTPPRQIIAGIMGDMTRLVQLGKNDSLCVSKIEQGIRELERYDEYRDVGNLLWGHLTQVKAANARVLPPKGPDSVTTRPSTQPIPPKRTTTRPAPSRPRQDGKKKNRAGRNRGSSKAAIAPAKENK